MSMKTIKLPNPKVLPGQHVLVHNYRSKPKDGSAVWEHGTVTSASLGIYISHDGRTFSKRWSYDVILDRKSRARVTYYGRDLGSNTIRLSVSDDSIKPV